MNTINSSYTVSETNYDSPAVARPYENAFDAAMKELGYLREAVLTLRDQVKPALQPELASEASAMDVNPSAPVSPVVREFDTLGRETHDLVLLVRSISDRVHI